VAEAKPIASLSSGLLARKGAARPAMRPQGFGQIAGQSLEDLGWNDMGFEPPKPAEAPRDSTHDAFGEDVVEHPRAHPTGLTPVQSPVHHQQAEIADRLGAEDSDEEADETAELYGDEVEEAPAAAPVAVVSARAPAPAPVAVPVSDPAPAPAPVARRAPRARSAPGSKAKAAFTLRLDPERHLKLRLACAVDGRSAQQLVTDALDQLLDRMPELDSMAAKAKRKG
jgi:predicted component of type VI protein secretion system